MKILRRFFLHVAAGLPAAACLSLAAVALALCACDAGEGRDPPRRVTVMSWNVQCLFDAVRDGTEYREYAGKDWTADKYIVRLDRLRSVILQCGRKLGCGPDRGPDIVVLQEIENANVLRDLCNRLPRRSSYSSAVFVPPEAGGAFGLAVLSRFPVSALTAHSLEGDGSRLRPLAELELQLGPERFTLFAVHWKSKSGESVDADAEPGADIRIRQELLLRDRMNRLAAPLFLACGDFNQTLAEFSVLGSASRAGNGWAFAAARAPLDACESPGSYLHAGEWEAIDHIWFGDAFADGKGLEFASFGAAAAEPFATAQGEPVRYEPWSGRGYSDHLPVLALLERVD